MTRQSWTVGGLAACVVLTGGLVFPGAVQATPLVDDYPAYLKAKPRDALVDPWYFYSRECTSFVAWRLNNDNHLPFSNSWGGVHWGNAYQWGAAARTLGFPINNSPSVGSVAWWNGSNPSASSFGHVAWVARVYTDGSVLIEEYNYLQPGNYDQRRLYPGTYQWPSGFLHVGDLTMKNVSPPTLSGAPTVGAPVTVSPGKWTPAGSVSFAYQWYAKGVPIPGATSARYTPTPDEYSGYLTVHITASMGGAKSTSAMTGTKSVLAGTLVPTGTPVVVGAPQVGVPLVAQGATWDPTPTVSYQWYSNGVAIPGATGPTYTPVPADLGNTITVAVTASTTGYRVASATLKGSSNVRPGVFKVTAVPEVSGGAPTVGNSLSASTGTWSPAGAYTYQWYANGVAVPGATSSTFTPTAGLMWHHLWVQVSATAQGYTTKTVSSAVTPWVLPGRFQAPPLANLSTPSVGAPLTIDPGTITGTTTPQIGYQWNVGGAQIPGATAATYTPAPADLGKQLSVTVTASAPGYYTLSRTTALSPPVQLGTLTVTTQPSFVGTPHYGARYQYVPAAWSARPSVVSLQWYANGRPLYRATGATEPMYSYLVGTQLLVIERVSSPGYHDATISTAAPAIVMGGRPTLASGPTISGNALVGSLLTANIGSAWPQGASTAVQWLRDGVPISGATGTTYRVTTADIGHRLVVQATVSKDLWTTTTYSSGPTASVQSPATMTTKLTRLSTGKVHLVMTVTAPGVSDPAGMLQVWWASKDQAKLTVVRGAVTVDLVVPSTVKAVNVVYLGDPRIQVTRQYGVAIH